MRIVTLLPPRRLDVIRRATAPDDEIVMPASADEFVQAATAPATEAVVLDPMLLGDEEWRRVAAQVITGVAGVLVYASLDSRAVARVLNAARFGIDDVMLADVDDDVATVAHRLGALRQSAPPARVLSRLAARLETLPGALQCAVLPLFSAAPVPRWVDDFAADAAMSRRSVDRWMRRAGLAGTGAVLDVARLARAWVPLVLNKVDYVETARLCGFAQRRMLWRHSRRLIGVTPTQLGTVVGLDEFVTRLTEHALRA